MRRLISAVALATIVAGSLAGPTSADPGSSTNAQYRALPCSDGNSYRAWFVGPSASFHLAGSTSMYVLSSIAISDSPSDPPFFVKDYGKAGVEPDSLVTCTYTDPQGLYNVLVGFFTPA